MWQTPMTQPPFEAAGTARRSGSPLQKLTDMPIRTKLTIVFAVLLALGIGTVGFFVDRAASAGLEASMGQNLKSRVDARSQIISDWLGQQVDELSALSLT